MVTTAEGSELARIAYHAYGETTDHKNFQGNPMPAWDDLGDQIRAAWTSAARAVAEAVKEAP